ncbi:hypothetical protein ACWEWX_11315 [Streptomyces asiaticus]
MALESIEEGFNRWRDRALEAELEIQRLKAEIEQRAEAGHQHVQSSTGSPDPRQPAYDAVFAYIRQQPRDFLPATVVDRNTMIWRAVHAALDAMNAPSITSHTYEGDGGPCTAEAYGQTCGAPHDAHELHGEEGEPA